MPVDLLASLTAAVEKILAADAEGPIRRDHPLGHGVPWRPHLFEDVDERAWYLLSETPQEDFWSEIIQGALAIRPSLRIGVSASFETLKSATIITALDSFGAQILPFEQNGRDFALAEIRASIADVVIERAWILDHRLASTLLDHNWQRAKQSVDPHEKGRILERVGRLLLSQVSGWRVQGGPLRRRNQEIDIAALNERAGGVLGRGEIIMGEAKNRTEKVDPDQYVAFRNKIRKTNGLSKIGFMISTAGFTQGALLESARDSESDTLVVLLDERALLHIWKAHDSMTDGITAVVLQAIQDQRQIRVAPDW